MRRMIRYTILQLVLVFVVGAVPTHSQLLVFDDFGDGVVSDWTTYGSCWNESGGLFQCSTTPPNAPIAAIRSDGDSWTDYSVEVDVQPLGTYQPSQTGIVFRFGAEYPIGDFCDCAFNRYQGTYLVLYCLGGPARTVPFAFDTSHFYRLRATVVGDQATCEVVGAPETLLSESFPAAAPMGSAGLRSTHIASNFDNFRVVDLGATSDLRIVFSVGGYPNARPWIANLDGSNAHQLADVSLASQPRLAANTVVFMSEDYLGQGSGIYRMEATPGAPVTKIPNTENIRTANSINWDAIDLSPDGTRMVWAAPEPGDYYQNHNVFVMNVDGTGKVRILRDTGKHFFAINWGEPDRISFGRSNVGNAYSQRLHTIAPDGTGLTQVVAEFAQSLHIGGPDGRAALSYGTQVPIPLATMDNSFGDLVYLPGPVTDYYFFSWHPTLDVLFGARGGSLYRIDRISGLETLILPAQSAPIYGGDVGYASATPPGPSMIVLASAKDSFLRQGASDTNEGANDALRIQSSGKNRALVGFDLTGIDVEAVSSARLVLTIADLTDNWGSSGRFVSAHPLLSDWSEGNGWTVGGNDRGSGPGVTWACATDEEIANQRPDCPDGEWNGGEFGSATGPAVLHTNGMTGEVEFDVTADVLAGHTSGWLIAKDIEGQNGKVYYYSREGASLAEDPDLGPRLILDFAE